MFDSVKSPSVYSHLLLVPDEPTAHFVAHVIGRLRRIECGIGTLSICTRIVTDVRSPISSANISGQTVVSL